MGGRRAALRPMEHADVPACVDLVARAMDADEARFALATFRFHFACRQHAIDDGRRLFVCEIAGRLRGVVGLHHYHWGPPENVWLSWFAVDPEFQGAGLGSQLFESATRLARDLGHRRLFIETYSSPTFDRAVRFYRRHGFRQAGSIEGYLPNGAAMLVFSRRIERARENEAERILGGAS